MYQPHEFAPTDTGYRGPVPSWEPGAPSLWLVDARQEGERARRLAPDILDDEELGRAGSLVVEADRLCYLASHVALRMLLGARLGVAPAAVPLRREPCPSCGGPHGRPATDGGVHFSLSHTRGIALLAFAGTPVGADVEATPQARTVAEIGDQLHPAERRELAELPEDQRPAAFVRAWTRKEAYLKGTGFGLAGGLSHDHLGTGPHPQPGPAGWTVTDVAVPAGHAAAVAVRTAGRAPATAADRRK
ncbi:4'-phosphopantetheinyl transferase family protein [Streptomyces sp. NPDC058221]|uniref:4'-phosphopantetheinyl transferase family protein n=1 Tax=Streptomyces sp. NPDC058221 TaxID=3346388 RepID=UPI0036E5C8C6